MPNISLNICQSETCKGIGFSDDTGNYSASLNVGGYRTTNLSEISRVQTRADLADDLNNTFFTFSSPQTDYYAWFNTGAGVDPAVAGATGVEVTIATNDTAVVVAVALSTAIRALADFHTAILTDIVTIINFQTGNVTDIADGAAPTGFVFNVEQAGEWNDVGLESILGIHSDVTGAYIEYELPDVTYTDLTFEASATTVDTTAETLTIASHGLSVRDQIVLSSENTPATLPGGLSEDVVYYVIYIDVNTIALATSALNATIGTRINLTSTGSETVTVATNVIDVFDTLPNVDGTIFNINTSDVNYATSTSFPDGVYTFRYVITGNGGGADFTVETYREFLLYCANKCCIYNLIAQIPEADCSCKDDMVDRALFGFIMLQALKYAAQVGQKERADAINATLLRLCEQDSCASCS